MSTLRGGSDHVYAVAISPDGQWLASGGRARGGFGTLWNHTFGHHSHGGNGITVRLWRARDGALQQALAENADDVRSVDFSPDGKWLASSSEDGAVSLWSLETAAASSLQHLP
jgi:WD40 repeat protein